MPEALLPQTQVLVEAAGEGRWLVTEIRPAAECKPTRDEVLRAIESSTWRPMAAWDEIRKTTREL